MGLTPFMIELLSENLTKVAIIPVEKNMDTIKSLS